MGSWNYWKELPYHGEPPDDTPKNRKPKRKRTKSEIRRDNIVGSLKLLLICGIIFGVIYFSADRSLEQALGPALYIIAIVILPFILSAGINAWNRYLRADDLDEPEDLEERRKATSPRQEDKHDLAEDYLAQIKWQGEHPDMGDGSRPDLPNWKYKPMFGKTGSTSSSSRIGWGFVILAALIATAGYSLFQMLTTSEFPTVAAILSFILLGLLFLVTNMPQRPTDA